MSALMIKIWNWFNLISLFNVEPWIIIWDSNNRQYPVSSWNLQPNLLSNHPLAQTRGWWLHFITTSRIPKFRFQVMVGVAQVVEHRVVAPVVVGSSPITHPIINIGNWKAANFQYSFYAPVAQLDRAPDFESVGRGFESLRARHKFKRVCRDYRLQTLFYWIIQLWIAIIT